MAVGVGETGEDTGLQFDVQNPGGETAPAPRSVDSIGVPGAQREVPPPAPEAVVPEVVPEGAALPEAPKIEVPVVEEPPDESVQAPEDQSVIAPPAASFGDAYYVAPDFAPDSAGGTVGGQVASPEAQRLHATEHVQNLGAAKAGEELGAAAGLEGMMSADPGEEGPGERRIGEEAPEEETGSPVGGPLVDAGGLQAATVGSEAELGAEAKLMPAAPPRGSETVTEPPMAAWKDPIRMSDEELRSEIDAFTSKNAVLQEELDPILERMKNESSGPDFQERDRILALIAENTARINALQTELNLRKPTPPLPESAPTPPPPPLATAPAPAIPAPAAAEPAIAVTPPVPTPAPEVQPAETPEDLNRQLYESADKMAPILTRMGQLEPANKEYRQLSEELYGLSQNHAEIWKRLHAAEHPNQTEAGPGAGEQR